LGNRKNKHIGEFLLKNDDNDFGFTFADEESFVKPDNTKLLELRAMIIPLLNNLKKNPDKDIIQWPGKDRIKRIDIFIARMDKLIND
jgi:hypothetical protein